MSVIEGLQSIQEEHKHETHSILKFKAKYCKICYSPPEITKLSRKFLNFWDWISNYCEALSYTSYTTTTFQLFVAIFSNEIAGDNVVSYRITDFAYRIIGSLTYQYIPNSKALVYYLINTFQIVMP
jgi:hypothetical protein